MAAPFHGLWVHETSNRRYAFAAFRPNGFIAEILEIVDITDPGNPTHVARWWYPGMGENPAEVALAVGCANQSHFSALFHRATGMTPLAYRIRNKAAVDVATASLRYTAREAAGKLAESGESSTPLTFTGR